MAGPTPVSALIHAATMVTAGVYMVCAHVGALRCRARGARPSSRSSARATAIFAATIGIAQNDIKKVLAYSTVSQLGYMFLAAGVGAYIAAIFHLDDARLLQGAALPRLGLGDPRASDGEQDMREDGRPAKRAAAHLLDLPDRRRSRSPASRRSPASSARTRSSPASSPTSLPPLGGRAPHRRAHRLLHVPRRASDLSRRVPRHPRAGAPPPRVAAGHGGPAPGPLRRRDRRRLGRHPGGTRRWRGLPPPSRTGDRQARGRRGRHHLSQLRRIRADGHLGAGGGGRDLRRELSVGRHPWAFRRSALRRPLPAPPRPARQQVRGRRVLRPLRRSATGTR